MKTSTVTATEANRSFSKLLRAIQRGEKVEITSHGRKIAVLKPIDSQAPTREERLKAFEELKRHWATLEPVTIGPWTREELYERD